MENSHIFFFGYHDALKIYAGHQSYVLLCSKITSFQPSEGVCGITFWLHLVKTTLPKLI